ncbi:MAG TPA: hypothetical protein VJK09_02300 [Candidatus Paceibacterota bacterium]
MNKTGIIVLLIVLGVIFAFQMARKVLPLEKYTNDPQEFELSVPKDANINTSPDSSPYFSAFFESNGIKLIVKKNQLDETTPLFLPDLFPACRTSGTVDVSGKYKLNYVAYSSADKDDETGCRVGVKSEHTVFTRFCVGDNGEAYKTLIYDSVEGGYYCNNNDSEYNINILCSGTEWSSLPGQQKCIDLFNQILASFKTKD